MNKLARNASGPRDDRAAEVLGLIQQGILDALATSNYDHCFDRLCQALSAAGLPLLRGHLGLRTLHPMMAAVDLVWMRDGALQIHPREHVPEPRQAWLESPLYWLISNGEPEMRQDLREPESVARFPVFRDFIELGGTDYFAAVMLFGDPETAAPQLDGVITSWLSDAPEGFSRQDMVLLRQVLPLVGLVAKLSKRDHTAHNVLGAYLGEEVARRVLAGQTQLGDVERIPAVIWFSDLRDSTAMAQRMQPEAFLEVVNAYFQCSAGAVLDCAGQVLRFIGDAVLAVFPVGNEGPRRAAEQALAASCAARDRMAGLNSQRARQGLEPLAFGLGLHVGDVLYGNIGVPTRLEFSVIGTAANEASRLEGLTKQLGEPVLASRAFVDALATRWRPLGRHDVAGVTDGLEVFAPPQRGP